MALFPDDHADMRQVAPLLREIDSVADHELVRNFEADPVDLDLDLAP